MKTLVFILFLFSPILGLSQQKDEIAAIELTRRNVLYLGIDNPVKVAVSGCKAKDVKVSVENAKMQNYEDYFIIRPQNMNTVVLTISCKDKNIRKATFRVEKSPEPVAQVGGITEETVNKHMLLAQNQLRAVVKDFDYDLRFVIEKFTIIVFNEGVTKKLPSNSSKFTNEQLNEIRKLKVGQTVVFTNIQAKGSDGTTRTLADISLVLR